MPPTTTRTSLHQRFVATIDGFLHPAVRQRGGAELRSARLIWVFFSFGFLALSAAIVIRLITGDHELIEVRASLVLALVAVPLTLRFSGSPRTTNGVANAVMLVGIATICTLSGGARSKALYLFAAIPFFAGIFADRLRCTVWMVVSVAAIGGFFALDAGGVTWASRIEPHTLRLDLALFLVVLCAVLISSVFYWRQFREASRDVRQSAQHQLRSNEAIARMHAKLSRANAAKRGFLQQVSAELSAPLGGLVRSAQRLPTAMAGDDDNRQLARMVERSANLLRRHIMDILHVLGRDSSPTSDAVLDLSVELDGIAAFFWGETNGRNVVIDLQVPAMTWLKRGDVERLRQVLIVLLRAALNHTDNGHVKIVATTRDNHLVIAIGEVLDPWVQLQQPATPADFSPASRLLSSLGGVLQATTTAQGGYAFQASLPLAASAIDAVAVVDGDAR